MTTEISYWENMAMTESVKLKFLVVDDSEDDRILHERLVRKIFEESILFDVEITTAQNGAEALEQVRKQYQDNKDFHIVISDFNMPEMTGEELAQILAQEFFSLPVIIITDALPEHHMLPEQTIILKKGVSRDDLRMKIAECLRLFKI